MKHLFAHIIILITVLVFPLSAMRVDIPNELPAYENLAVTLTPSEGEGPVMAARLYFYQEGKRDPLYAEFTQENGEWGTTLPYPYLQGEELEYYTVIQNTSGTFFRDPGIGTAKARLLHDETPPELKLLSPETFELSLGREQLVVFQILDESSLNEFTLTLNGEPLTRSGVFSEYLSFLIEPTDASDIDIAVTMKDRYGNESMEEFTFTVTEENVPLFAASADFDARLETEYLMSMGETQNTTDIGEIFGDSTHAVNLSWDLNGETFLKAGPVSLEMHLGLKDTVAAQDILDSYPNTLIADLQNFLNLYNPIDLTSDFDYTGEEARVYGNDNTAYVRLFLFDPAISYTFGDQNVYYQNETIKNMPMRGSSLSIDLPFLNCR